MDGQYQRSGKELVLVSKHSATGGRYKSDPASTIQIDANHSEMVKFSPGDHLITVIAAKLREMPRDEPFIASSPQEQWTNKVDPGWLTVSRPGNQSATVMMNEFSEPSVDPTFWDKDCKFRS